jgi:hypothetical protein
VGADYNGAAALENRVQCCIYVVTKPLNGIPNEIYSTALINTKKRMAVVGFTERKEFAGHSAE